MLVGTWAPWFPLLLIGFPPEMIFLQSGLNLLYQFWIHTEAIRRMPAWFEYLFNTPSHHRVHHASNPRYVDRNYAGMFMVWDRMFGTFAAERDDDPPKYGLIHNIDTYNPFRIAFHEWAAMFRDVRRARSLREFGGYVFGPPGWRPDGADRPRRTCARRGSARERVQADSHAAEPEPRPSTSCIAAGASRRGRSLPPTQSDDSSRASSPPAGSRARRRR